MKRVEHALELAGHGVDVATVERAVRIVAIAGSTTEFVRPILNAFTATMSARPIAATLSRVLPLMP